MTHRFRLYFRDTEVSKLMAEKLYRAAGDDVSLHVQDGQAHADWEIEADSMLDAVKAALAAAAVAGFHVARALPLNEEAQPQRRQDAKDAGIMDREEEPVSVVWCACRVVKWHVDHCEWQFQGAFASEAAAAAACVDETWFIGPARLGERLPIEGYEWPGAYYPLLAQRSRPLEDFVRELHDQASSTIASAKVGDVVIYRCGHCGQGVVAGNRHLCPATGQYTRAPPPKPASP